DNGVVFYGDKGTLSVGRAGAEINLIGEEPKNIGPNIDFSGNLKNFIDCVKARTPEKLNAPIREGALSALLVHYANAGTRLGRPFELNADGSEARGDAEITALFKRTYREGYELP